MNSLQNRLTARESVWERLRGCGKPVVLYGMGDGAQKVLDACEGHGVAVAGIFASDEFVRGQSFAGHKVLRYDEVCQKYDDFIVAVAFATQLPAVLKQIYRIAEEHETVAPDVPVMENSALFTPDFLRAHHDELEQAYALLADEPSRAVFASVVDYKIGGKLCDLRASESPLEEAYRLLGLGADEDYIDLGAYRGDTVEELLRYTGGAYHSITALEPDVKTFAKLQARISELGLKNVVCHNLGAWSGQGELRFAGKSGRNSALSKQGEHTVAVNSVDNLLKGRRASYIKLDVEGSEREALAGCARTIAAHAPKLCVSAYHRSEDLFALPLQLHALRPEYRLFLRRFSYLPAWDLNLYAL